MAAVSDEHRSINLQGSIMASSIGAVGAQDMASKLFDKLDTKQKGYLDAADLKGAAGPQASDAQLAEVFGKLDNDSDGRVTKSELSTAIEKVGEQLSAQQDQSRVKAGSAGARPAGPPPGGGGGPPPAGGDDAAETDVKYIAAADADGNGTVSEAEEAAYEQALAKAAAQANEYKKVEGDVEPGPDAVSVVA